MKQGRSGGAGREGTGQRSGMGKKILSVLLILILAVIYLYVRMDDVRVDGSGSAGEEIGIPAAYDGEALEVINDNIPDFPEEMLTTRSYEKYSKLDALGRCGAAEACLSVDTMPEQGERRGDISEIHPSGWKSGMGWERCHLIAWSLSAESANERNLITGTHTMNQAMLPYEEATVAYIRETKNHVMYQVIPDYEGDNLIANGIHLQAFSVEDNGKGISFNIYCHNVEPGSTIDYRTGAVLVDADVAKETEATYVLNKNSMKFHRPECEGVKDIYKRNRETVKTRRSELILAGYEPCGICQP